LIKERYKSLDLENEKDRSFNLQDKKQNSNSSDFTLDDLDSLDDNSVYSSPRLVAQKEWMAYDKVLPFDFIT